MSDSRFDELRRLNRQKFHLIWKAAREGELETLSEEDRRIGKIMLSHSEEYFNQFEFADALADGQHLRKK